MTAGRLASVALLLAVAAPSGVRGSLPPAQPVIALEVHEADRGTLDTLLSEPGVVRRVSDPSWGAYLQAQVERLEAWVGGLLRPLGESTVLPTVMTWAAIVIVASAALAAAGFLVARVLLRVEGRRPRAEPVTEAPVGPRIESATIWRQRLEQRLDAADVPRALQALWWWLATTLCRDEIDPAWTSRELLARTDRGDLLSLVATLDGFAYGPVRPHVEQVRTLVGGFEARLA